MGRHSGKKSFWHIISPIVGLIICIILVPILIMNITIVVKSYMNPDKVPDFFGIKPFVVLSGSMEPKIAGGDLVITKTVVPATLKTDDIVSFKEGNAVITHRIVGLTANGGDPAFITQGDANNAPDENAVTYSQIEGVYLFKIPGLGRLAMFMQTPTGMLVFIGIPLCAFVIYDIVRRRLADHKKQARDDEAQDEIERLKAQLAEKSREEESEFADRS